MHKDIIKLLRTEMQKHPHPELMLREVLEDGIRMFTPKTLKQATDFLAEYICITAKFASVVMASHINKHEEAAQDCVPELLKHTQIALEEITKANVAEICKAESMLNPFLEPSTNEKTREEILATFLKEKTDG